MNTISKPNKSIYRISRVAVFSTCILGLSPLLSARAPISPEYGKAKVSKATDGEEQTKVQIAILLDTSSSMDGLIDQARSQLWKVVNAFNEAEKGGKIPFVEVSLYEYGNNGLDMQGHYIR